MWLAEIFVSNGVNNLWNPIGLVGGGRGLPHLSKWEPLIYAKNIFDNKSDRNKMELEQII